MLFLYLLNAEKKNKKSTLKVQEPCCLMGNKAAAQEAVMLLLMMLTLMYSFKFVISGLFLGHCHGYLPTKQRDAERDGWMGGCVDV